LWLRAEILSEDGRECEAGEMWLDAPADARHLARQLLDRAGPALKALFTG
jgi:hydroxymethylbilane synthase